MCLPHEMTEPAPAEYEKATQDRKRKRRLKEARFQEEVATRRIGTTTTEGEVNSKWYCRTDIALFKLDAKDHVLGRKANPETMRGFEHYRPERKINKKRALEYTLRAARMGMSEEKIATVATCFSEKAQEVAFKTGCEDFCQAYYPEMVGLISNCFTNNAQGAPL